MENFISTSTRSNSAELIKLMSSGSTKVVPARELYSFLEITERFNNWFQRMVGYGFVENQDFTSVNSFTLVNNGAQRQIDDYALTFDCAKHIAMVQRSEKGMMARQYFINAEKELRQIQSSTYQLPQTYQDALRELADKEDQRLLLEQQNTQLIQHNSELKEVGKKMLPAFQYCESVRDTEDLSTIQEVAKNLNYEGVGPNQLFEILRKQGILRGGKGKEKNQPYAAHTDKFVLRENPYTDPSGKVHITYRTFVTMRGKAYINKLLKKMGYKQNWKQQ